MPIRTCLSMPIAGALQTSQPTRSLTGSRSLTCWCRIQLLRDIHSFFSTTFKIKPLPPSEAAAEGGPLPQEYLLSCLGIGYTNLSKGVA